VRRFGLSARVLGVEQTVVESIRIDMAANAFVVSARPYAAISNRYGVCRQPYLAEVRG
jgi:hypothetical protein